MMKYVDYIEALPAGVRSRVVNNGNGLMMHVLEAGHERSGRPRVLLLHGFPELAYSWRKVIPELARAGYHVIAPDQRGYGRTTGWDPNYEGDLASFRLFNIVRDAMGLLFAMGYDHVDALVGHDFGSVVSAWCALLRPDIFRKVVLMSAPFAGPPRLPLVTEGSPRPAPTGDIHSELAALDPPRKHYHWYYSTREANDNMLKAPQGLHAFLRAYYHHKSADWIQNQPFKLKAWTAAELAKLPTYYVMPKTLGMAQTVAAEMPSQVEIDRCRWLSDEELAVYSTEYSRTGFQGGLQWYRCRTEHVSDAEMEVFSGSRIEVPAAFISGKSDWGVYQSPGAFEKMRSEACSRMTLCELVEGAGHWVQQEQPEAVTQLLLRFFQQNC